MQQNGFAALEHAVAILLHSLATVVIGVLGVRGATSFAALEHAVAILLHCLAAVFIGRLGILGLVGHAVGLGRAGASGPVHARSMRRAGAKAFRDRGSSILFVPIALLLGSVLLLGAVIRYVGSGGWGSIVSLLCLGLRAIGLLFVGGNRGEEQGRGELHW